MRVPWSVKPSSVTECTMYSAMRRRRTSDLSRAPRARPSVNVRSGHPDDRAVPARRLGA
jgi:hypothetical protein